MKVETFFAEIQSETGKKDLGWFFCSGGGLFTVNCSNAQLVHDHGKYQDSETFPDHGSEKDTELKIKILATILALRRFL